jgi:DNA repair protein RadA/Sms
VTETARVHEPFLLAVDSIQTLRYPDATSLPGGPGQVRSCADALVGLAKRENIAVLVTGHVTKDGDLAGPRTLEHAVDVVLSFEGDARTGLRTLAGGKNRFGPEGEVAWFEMGPDGLRETDGAGALAPGAGETGSALGLTMAGRRALAVEVQALAVPTDGPPRRQVSGLDLRRFSLIAAVLHRAAGLPLFRTELFGAAAGGVRLDDPGTDLAVAAAMASAVSGTAPPEHSAFVGEVSLTGQVRPVPGLDQRLAAASARGVREVFVPAAPEASGTGRRAGSGPTIVQVRTVAEALRWALGARRTGSAGRPPGRSPAGRREVATRATEPAETGI